MRIVWELSPCCLFSCFNLLQGTAIYHAPKVKDLLSTEEWAEVPWLRILGTQVFRSEKSYGLSGYEIRLSTVCSDYIWLLLHECQINLQDGLPRDIVGADKDCFFCKTLLKLGKMFRNITYVHSCRRKVWYVNVENHVSCSCYRQKTWERRAIGSWKQLPGHSWGQVALVRNTRPFLRILLHLVLSSSRSSRCCGSAAITMLSFH